MTIVFCVYKRNTMHWKSFDEAFDNKDHHYSMAIEILINNYEGVYTSYHDIDNLSELEEKSDVIAIVQLKNRKQIYNNIESHMEVVKLFKGNCDKDIIVVEAGEVFNNRVYNDGIYPLMKEDELYIVFLQETNGVDTYNYVDESFSMYLLKDDYDIKELKYQSNQIISYDIIKNYDYYIIDYSNAVYEGIYDQEQVDTYNLTINKYFEFSEIVKSKYK